MITGLISDIHGDRTGLATALDFLAARGCDRVVCLGDLVDGGGDPAGVVDLVRARCQVAVQGNHDACNDAGLDRERQAWLDGLPALLAEGDRCYTHASPRRRRWEAIADEAAAWNVFDDTAWRLVFVGHLHRSLVFGERSGLPTSARLVPIPYGDWLPLDPTDRYLVSVGPVGYSRDGDPAIRCGIHDEEGGRLAIHRLPRPKA